MIYLDTSALVPYYYPEPLSARVQQILQAQSQRVISEAVEVELHSALARKVREHALTPSGAQRIATLFLRHVEDGIFSRLSLRSAHYRLAREWIGRFDLPLRTLDALHLATAAFESLPLVTADEQLARSASILGIETIFLVE
ncbi:type II toxin-antitoxin system VapC family toxin [Thermithiobacillus plumbiphilus]|uniref:Ribonuclease VapC n=1 Tax=Thermithiobacillus plumbiphilus TaxID=1729899 RepID=A0ABU9DEB3_9PROT